MGEIQSTLMEAIYHKLVPNWKVKAITQQFRQQVNKKEQLLDLCLV